MMVRSITSLGALLISAALALAATPQTMHYQAVLLSGGNPVVGPVDVTFTLYDADAGGNVLWTQMLAVTPDAGGIANVMLGEGAPIPDTAFASGDVWLGVQIEADPELTPRSKLSSTPYAFRVETIDGAAAGGLSGILTLNPDLNKDAAITNSQIVLLSEAGDSVILGPPDGTAIRAVDNGGTEWLTITHDPINGAVMGIRDQGGNVRQDDALKSTFNSGGETKAQMGAEGLFVFGATSTDTLVKVGPSGNVEILSQTSGIKFGDGTVQFTQSGAANGLPQPGGTMTGPIESVGAPYIHMGKANLGSGNTNAGDSAFVAGVNNSAAGYVSTISGGFNNSSDGSYATVGGGQSNVADTSFATVAGGSINVVADSWGTVGGGELNTSSAAYATIAGGFNNTVSGPAATVGGGGKNKARGHYSVVAGGGGLGDADSNLALGINSAVGGGRVNYATGDESTISGGAGNTAGAVAATIGGGGGNTASSNNATIGGGYGNTASDGAATVSGGESNVASGLYATVGGGGFNKARGSLSVISGGGSWVEADSNLALGDNSTIGGGNANYATGFLATVSGGYSNTASGLGAAIGGGDSNTAAGYYSAVPGGSRNLAGGDYSFAAGRRASAIDNGTFVWADQSDFDFPTGTESNFTPAADMFMARSTGGVAFVSGIDGSGNSSAGVQLPAGGGSWASLSDRNLKENLQAIDGKDILAKIASIPISTWNYKAQDETIRHIGPMAQDFYSAFGVGEDERHITAIDGDGVALAAIQELHRSNEELRKQVGELQEIVKALLAERR